MPSGEETHVGTAALGRPRTQVWVGHSCPTPLILPLVLAFCFSYQPVMPSGEETHVGTAALGCPPADVGRTLLSDAFDLASGSCFCFLSTCHAEWRRNSCGDSRPRPSSDTSVGRTLLSDAFDLASGSCFLLFLSTCHAEWRRNSCGDSCPRLSSGGCGSDTPVRRL